MPTPPSSAGAAAGAEILLNLSASNIVIGKAQMRRLLCASQSARCISAYAYSAALEGNLEKVLGRAVEVLGRSLSDRNSGGASQRSGASPSGT